MVRAHLFSAGSIRMRFNPWVREESLWKGHWQSSVFFALEDPCGPRGDWRATVHGAAESWTAVTLCSTPSISGYYDSVIPAGLFMILTFFNIPCTRMGIIHNNFLLSLSLLLNKWPCQDSSLYLIIWRSVVVSVQKLQAQIHVDHVTYVCDLLE